MKTLTFVDKSVWKNRGEWDLEPDKLEWRDESTGLPCLIVRGPMGALCGYVGIPEGHRLHGKDYDFPEVNVHGGLRYSGHCQRGNPERGICHVPSPGEPDNVWWFGFDASHAGDLIPMWGTQFDHVDGEVYRNIDYMRIECRDLANQLAAIR